MVHSLRRLIDKVLGAEDCCSNGTVEVYPSHHMSIIPKDNTDRYWNGDTHRPRRERNTAPKRTPYGLAFLTRHQVQGCIERR